MPSPDPSKVSTSMLSPAAAGRFRLFGLLGEIGDGALYHAVRESDQKRVGFLRVEEGDSAGPGRAVRYMEATERNEHERHPAIVPLIGFGEEDEGLYLATGRLGARTARQHLLADGPMDADLAIEITLRALDAMSPWHAENEVFGTVCAESAIIDVGRKLDVFQLLPPTLAQLLLEDKPGDDELVSHAPMHRAPEVILGEEVDPRADLFAIGVLLFELLTGEAPFAAPTRAAELARVEKRLGGREESLDRKLDRADSRIREIDRSLSDHFGFRAVLGLEPLVHPVAFESRTPPVPGAVDRARALLEVVDAEAARRKRVHLAQAWGFGALAAVSVGLRRSDPVRRRGVLRGMMTGAAWLAVVPAAGFGALAHFDTAGKRGAFAHARATLAQLERVAAERSTA